MANLYLQEHVSVRLAASCQLTAVYSVENWKIAANFTFWIQINQNLPVLAYWELATDSQMSIRFERVLEQ